MVKRLPQITQIAQIKQTKEKTDKGEFSFQAEVLLAESVKSA
jgi:hypothetical protein